MVGGGGGGGSGGVRAWWKHVYLVTWSDGFIITTGFFSNIFTAVAGRAATADR